MAIKCLNSVSDEAEWWFKYRQKEPCEIIGRQMLGHGFTNKWRNIALIFIGKEFTLDNWYRLDKWQKNLNRSAYEMECAPEDSVYVIFSTVKICSQKQNLLQKRRFLDASPVHQEQVVQNLGFRTYAEVRVWLGISIYRIIYIMEN